MTRMTISQARRIAIAAQGLGRPRPSGRVDRRHLRRAFADMGVIQIDSVNVIARSHELVLFSRLGPHPRSLLPDAVAAGEIFEYWVHEASFVPAAHHHLHRWRQERPHPWRRVRSVADHRGALVEALETRIRDQGAVTARQVRERRGPGGPWWDWDDPKAALEWLFWKGRVAAVRETKDFSRRYDLPERLIDPVALAVATPPPTAIREELILLAARHHGIATLEDLADYHRQRPRDVAAVVEQLVRDRRLETVEVEGWDRIAYRDPKASAPRTTRARALLSPFDPMVWHRPRAERLFDFHYRLEIYTPAAQRRHGYYVMPFLLGDRLVARVDLRADRARSRLVVPGVFAEDRVDRARVADELAGELADELVTMATWLDLDDIEVGERGDLASPLRRALGRAAP